MTSPYPISERQLPPTVLTYADLFGAAYSEWNDRLTPVGGSTTVYQTSFLHILGKIMVWVGTAPRKLLRSEFTEDQDGVTITLDTSSGGEPVTASYLKPGTMEYLGWVPNETPKSGEEPDGVRTQFHTRHTINSPATMMICADGLPLEASMFSVPGGVGSDLIQLTFAPDQDTKLDWMYTTSPV